MRTRILSITLLMLVITIILNISTTANAEPRTVSPDTLLSETLILEAITWAPRGLTNSTSACDLAKEQALTQLGIRVQELRIVEQTGTTSFPSHLSCQWDVTRQAYQTILSITVPSPREPISRTSHRLY